MGAAGGDREGSPRSDPEITYGLGQCHCACHRALCRAAGPIPNVTGNSPSWELVLLWGGLVGLTKSSGSASPPHPRPMLLR